MIHIEQAIIVEGKYDKIKLASILDAVIIETDGFAVFRDKEKQALLRRLAAKKGLLVLTDSDAAGFMIRNFIGGCVPKETVRHAYIPDILGKEKRKSAPSKEGKLGVEGVEKEVILQALQNAGVICGEVKKETEKITSYDLYADGFTGGKNSRAKRAMLLKRLDLPERLSTPALLQILNVLMTPDDYRTVVREIENETEGSGNAP